MVKVSVPATSANIGSGFDSCGLALSLYNTAAFEEFDGVDITSSDGTFVPSTPGNLIYRTAKEVYALCGRPFHGLRIVQTNPIPMARGLGSSSACIAAGILGANALLGGPLEEKDILTFATKLEGHPDNVAPAVFGGLTVSWDFETAEGVGSVAVPGGEPLHGGFHAVNYPVDPSITAAVFVPDYELSTEKARQALPRELPYKDAVYNVSRVGLLPAAMNPMVLAQAAQQGKSGVAAAPAQDADTCACAGGTRESPFADELAAAQAQSNALLFTATQDKLHQPYRGTLMPPSTELIALFRSKGYAAAVSGAGPCVLVLHYGNAREAIDQIASEQLASGHWRVLHLPINTAGVEIERR